MSRLYDKVMRHGSRATMDLHMADVVRRGLNHAVVVDISNVAAYWAEVRGAEALKSTDMPVIAPSFHVAFFEYRWPRNGSPLDDLIESVGVLVLAEEAPEKEKRAEWTECRWHTHWFPFTKRKGKDVAVGPNCWNVMPITADGRLPRMLDRDEPGVPWLVAFPQDPAQMEEVSDVRRCYFSPVYLAMGFLNCRNVGLRTNVPPPKASRKHEKRHGFPLATYKTLEIDPMTAALERDGGASKHGLKRALHICRGHFATYSPERPRFGRDVGTFWISQHIRGSKKHGEVIKDYAVKALNGGAS